MRRGFLLAVLGALVLFALMLISRRSDTIFTAQPSSTVPADEVQTVDAPVETNFAELRELPPEPLLAVAPVKEKASEETSSENELHEARVEARIAELGDLATKTDRASLEMLLSEIKSPDQEIRQA